LDQAWLKKKCIRKAGRNAARKRAAGLSQQEIEHGEDEASTD
jgi:hypothetical protein